MQPPDIESNIWVASKIVPLRESDGPDILLPDGCLGRCLNGYSGTVMLLGWLYGNLRIGLPRTIQVQALYFDEARHTINVRYAWR
jgi:hypothetical protein